MTSPRRSMRTSVIANTQRSTTNENINQYDFNELEPENIYENEGRICELLTYERRYDSRGHAITLESGCWSEIDLDEDVRADAALVLMRRYNESKDLERTELQIRSPYIKAALKTVVKSYPGVNISTNGPVIISDNPGCLFHYRAELEKYAVSIHDREAKNHVRFCLQYMKKALQRELISYETMMQKGAGLEFKDLWMAFRPGALLYALDGPTECISRLLQMNKVEIKNRPTYWSISSETLMNDGTNFRNVMGNRIIHHYDGYKALIELDIFPLAYHPNRSEIKNRLLSRGKRYISFRAVHYCVTPYEHGRIIIDNKEYWSCHPPRFPPTPLDSKPILFKTNQDINIPDEEILLCQAIVYGFSCATKRWLGFDVSILEEVVYNKDAFANLVLSEETKRMLTSLVQLHSDQALQFDDLIRGKGKGVIVLLHGLPGVGKTFTAESIADYCGRPLYTIGKTDFGRENDNNTEQVLTTVLMRASKWNAIILLDEADVFMQERSAKEMARNEQVSVLLRVLEYFEGLMFLTTNRVQTIDSAFKSRIHLCIAYPALSTTARSKLWETFVLKGCEQQRPDWLTAKFLARISDEEVNGREIKNIVRIAHALSLDEKRAMQAEDLLLGLRSRNDFERDFSEALGKRRRDEDEVTSSTKRMKLNGREIDGTEESSALVQRQQAKSWWKFWIR